MRIWLDPDKLQSYGLSTTQVLNAVNAQNAQFAAGSLGADPAVKGQAFTATVTGDTPVLVAASSSRTSSCSRTATAPRSSSERRRAHFVRRAELWLRAGL